MHRCSAPEGRRREPWCLVVVGGSGRLLQVEEVGTAPQLLRLASQYSDLGLPVRTFTLSAIRFG